MSYDLQAKSVALADMKLLAPNTPVKRQAPLLHWHRWFAWYPVPIAVPCVLVAWARPSTIGLTPPTAEIYERARDQTAYRSPWSLPFRQDRRRKTRRLRFAREAFAARLISGAETNPADLCRLDDALRQYLPVTPAKRSEPLHLLVARQRARMNRLLSLSLEERSAMIPGRGKGDGEGD